MRSVCERNGEAPSALRCSRFVPGRRYGAQSRAVVSAARRAHFTRSPLAVKEKAVRRGSMVGREGGILRKERDAVCSSVSPVASVRLSVMAPNEIARRKKVSRPSAGGPHSSKTSPERSERGFFNGMLQPATRGGRPRERNE